MIKVSCESIPLTKEERSSGLVAMWDVVGRKGHYVISFGIRGFSGYQLECKDSAGESTLPPWQVNQIVTHFKLSA